MMNYLLTHCIVPLLLLLLLCLLCSFVISSLRCLPPAIGTSADPAVAAHREALQAALEEAAAAASSDKKGHASGGSTARGKEDDYSDKKGGGAGGGKDTASKSHGGGGGGGGKDDGKHGGKDGGHGAGGGSKDDKKKKAAAAAAAAAALASAGDGPVPHSAIEEYGYGEIAMDVLHCYVSRLVAVVTNSTVGRGGDVRKGRGALTIDNAKEVYGDGNDSSGSGSGGVDGGGGGGDGEGEGGQSYAEEQATACGSGGMKGERPSAVAAVSDFVSHPFDAKLSSLVHLMIADNRLAAGTEMGAFLRGEWDGAGEWPAVPEEDKPPEKTTSKKK